MAHEFPIAALSSTFSRWLMLQVMMARTPVSRSTARISTSTSRPPMAAKPRPALDAQGSFGPSAHLLAGSVDALWRPNWVARAGRLSIDVLAVAHLEEDDQQVPALDRVEDAVGADADAKDVVVALELARSWRARLAAQSHRGTHDANLIVVRQPAQLTLGRR
jgi:hypothetical protein